MAALLSFLWPGLGQLYTGRRRLAVFFAVPAVLVLLLLIYQLRKGFFVFATRLVTDRGFAIPVILVLVLLGAWRLAAVVHAYLEGERLKTRMVFDRAVLIALVAIIVVSHSAAGYSVWFFNNALNPAFQPNNPNLITQATAAPSLAPGVTQAPTPTLPPTPSIDSRVTILFTGVDADPTREEQLYDSIMVVSYDPSTNSVQMVSVPRDSASYPLYFGGQDIPSRRINSLPGAVRNGWVRSPDAPYPTLVKEVAYLVGIPIDYYAVMELNGFVKMIDMVGGIDVNNPSVIDDPVYATPVGEIIGFKLAAGWQHLDGNQALAYVRSRHGVGNGDSERASRQQGVLVDLLHKMAQPGQILQLPDLMSTLGSSVTTNFPANQLADYVAIGQSVPSGNFRQVVLGVDAGYSIYVDGGASCLLNYKVAQLSVELFGKDSTWSGKPLPANTCPL